MIAAIIGIFGLTGLAVWVFKQVMDAFRYEGVGSAIALMLLLGAVVAVALWGVWLIKNALYYRNGRFKRYL